MDRYRRFPSPSGRRDVGTSGRRDGETLGSCNEDEGVLITAIAGSGPHRIVSVRRSAAWVLAAALAAPAVLALAVPGVDFDALRCAIRCGHAVRAGVVCCPADAGAGASWKTCPAGDPVLAGLVAPPPAVLTLTFRVARPAGVSAVTPGTPPRPLSAFNALLDHVPLALS